MLSNVMQMSSTAIVWFRNDLRIHDNEALVSALSRHDSVIPVYVLDDRFMKSTTSFGFAKTGVFRTKFILESLHDLRKNLEAKGSTLIVRQGLAEQILTELAKETNAQCIYCNRERTFEEMTIQDKLEKSLWKLGKELHYVRGKMLYYTSDLPFPVSQVPDVFTQYRKEIESTTRVRDPFSTPESIAYPNINLDRGEVPALSDFGYASHTEVNGEKLRFQGGETSGLKQLQYYLWETDLIKNYKNSRNGFMGWDFSSKLSPWLAQGCLSPKKIYQELKKYEADRGANDSTYWLYFELLWRDYFRLMAKKYGNRIFYKSGIRGKKQKVNSNLKAFDLWAKANTGVPLVDACMQQLNQTGFMSNRGRQIVASYLVNDMHLDWRLGAEYFESLLLDYDPCSNYGNWNYLAGIGNDPREDRYFNIPSQAKKYDPNGEFVQFYLNEAFT